MRKKIIRQRTRYFLAVEGASEQSLVKWFQHLSEQQLLHVHLDCQVLDGGGYQTMLERVVRERKRKERSKAKSSILLVDSDRSERGDDGLSLTELKQQAFRQKIIVCAQYPNLEGLLLRMMPKNERLQIDGKKAHSQLRQAWPDYVKPVDTRSLAVKFTLADLLRVAKVDEDLGRLLKIIGLMKQI